MTGKAICIRSSHRARHPGDGHDARAGVGRSQWRPGIEVARAVTGGALVVLGLLALPGFAAADEDDFLPQEQAFRHSTAVAGDSITVTWDIADGYYLYRKRMGFASETPAVVFGETGWPTGESHHDEYFGDQEVYRGRQQFTLPISTRAPGTREVAVALKFQGCADAGLCYPPTTWRTSVTLPAAAGPRAAGRSSILSLVGAGRQKARSGEEEFLPVDDAFRFSARMDRPDVVTLTWVIAEGYYLYRHRIAVSTSSRAITLGEPVLPAGDPQHDEYFGDTEVYRGVLEVGVPVARPPGTGQLEVAASFQGCAEAGLCYPPTTRTATLDLPPASPVAGATGALRVPGGSAEPVAEQDWLADFIRNRHLLLVLAFFFVSGLGLAFTPCVLPMVPILSGIIAGEGTDVSSRRAFILSLAYVLGMALTYTVAGALFAAAGQQVQAVFQKPWIIATFAGLFVVLSLAMFGFYELQMPAALQSRIAAASNRQRAGTLIGSAVMGALSSLIVTACVAPPLVATLAVIGQSGDVVRGASALFALSLGMGAPLLVVGTSAGRLLPRAGPWMNVVKAAFGVIFLGLAIWMLARILPGPLTLALWAVLVFVAGYCVATLGREATGGLAAARRGAGGLAMVYGVIMLVGAAAGGADPLQPLEGSRLLARADLASGATQAATETGFKRIKTTADLDRELAAARARGLPVMLDFYADWCVSCKEMEKYTFTDAGVREVLDRGLLLQADVTANDAEDRALLDRFGIFGPPTIAFFGPDGHERRNFRLVGFVPAERFREHLLAAFSGS
jgi:thioredoxin:protein disulfide reductase